MPLGQELSLDVGTVSLAKPVCRFVSQGLRSRAVVLDLLAQVLPPGMQWVELVAQIMELRRLSLLLGARPREPAVIQQPLRVASGKKIAVSQQLDFILCLYFPVSL